MKHTLITPPKHFAKLKRTESVVAPKSSIDTMIDKIYARPSQEDAKAGFNPLIKELLEYSSKIVLVPLIEPDSVMDTDPQGYSPSKKEILIAYEMPTIWHEMAHMLEMNDLARLTKPDFGMKWNGMSRFNPRSMIVGAAREIRVRAIQSRLTDKVYCLHDNHHIMADIADILPYGKFKSKNDFLAWENQIWSTTFDIWTVDKIKTEWETRINYLHDWMEQPNEMEMLKM